jgi:hypothetical protein
MLVLVLLTALLAQCGADGLPGCGGFFLKDDKVDIDFSLIKVPAATRRSSLF